MHWITLTEKDCATASLEKRLWDAADQFRANSGLKAHEYSGPILDPGCMFVQSRRFVAEHQKKPAAESLRCRLPHGDRLVVETRGDELCPDWICP